MALGKYGRINRATVRMRIVDEVVSQINEAALRSGLSVGRYIELLFMEKLDKERPEVAEKLRQDYPMYFLKKA